MEAGISLPTANARSAGWPAHARAPSPTRPGSSSRLIRLLARRELPLQTMRMAGTCERERGDHAKLTGASLPIRFGGPVPSQRGRCMSVPMTDDQRAVLRAVCDTVVPSIERSPDPTGHWRRKASDIGVEIAFEQMLDTMPEANRAGLPGPLDALDQQHLRQPTQLSREQTLRNIALLGPEAAAGVGALVGLTLFLYYGMPVDPQTGQNPNWATFGYPGPTVAPPQVDKPIKPLAVSGDTTLEADAVVVGSGAGGAVVAATLAKQGLKVVIVEQGGYYNESDFAQLELKAYQEKIGRA